MWISNFQPYNFQFKPLLLTKLQQQEGDESDNDSESKT